jgi:hypothetical protein
MAEVAPGAKLRSYDAQTISTNTDATNNGLISTIRGARRVPPCRTASVLHRRQHVLTLQSADVRRRNALGLARRVVIIGAAGNSELRNGAETCWPTVIRCRQGICRDNDDNGVANAADDFLAGTAATGSSDRFPAQRTAPGFRQQRLQSPRHRAATRKRSIATRTVRRP